MGLRRLPIDNDKTGCSRALELDPYDWVIVHKRGSQHTNADSLSRRPDLSAELMDNDAPDSTHTLMHTGTQTVTDNDPTVCDVDTPTMSPTVDHSSSPGPHLPPDPICLPTPLLVWTRP